MVEMVVLLLSENSILIQVLHSRNILIGITIGLFINSKSR